MGRNEVGNCHISRVHKKGHYFLERIFLYAEMTNERRRNNGSPDGKQIQLHNI